MIFVTMCSSYSKDVILINCILKSLITLCPSLDNAAIARAYFSAKLIIAYSQESNYAETIRASHSLRTALYTYNTVVAPTLIEDNSEVWVRFCTALSSTKLDTNHRAFFDIFTPHLVLDWHYLTFLFPATDVGRLLVALCLVLADTPPDSLSVSQTWLQQHYEAHSSLYQRISIDFDTYVKCWRSTHLTNLLDSTDRPRDTIVQAARLYHSLQLPMTDLLNDYASLYLKADYTAMRTATRGARKTGRTTQLAEGGKSKTDLAFEQKLTALAQEQPTDVVRGLFYSSGRNDAGFECSYLLQRFWSTIGPDDRVLIANPSPDLISYVLSKRTFCSSLCFVVADNTLASIYSRQFGRDVFVAANELHNIHDTYNRILITPRDQTVTPMLDLLHLTASTGEITALIPETSLAETYKQLRSTEMQIHSMLTIPTNATQSSPRRKVLIRASFQWAADYFLLEKGICDKFQTLFSTDKHSLCISYKWLQSTMTLADMRKAATKKAVSRHPQEPLIVRYSPEIQLCLTIQSDRNGYVTGRTYYRQMLRGDSRDKHRKRGDRLTPVVEKGLRKHSVEEVINAVEITALDERIAPAVVKDVLNYSTGRLGELSLKTAWYCLRRTLLTKHTYDEKLALSLFSRDNLDLSSLIVGRSQADDYDRALSAIYLDRDSIPKKCWALLNLILNTAKEKGYINYNPLAEHMAVVSARFTKRQQEVRNALTKKTFELAEERKILSVLLSHTNNSTQGWMITDPLALIVPIVMLAVPNLREAVALKWMDLIPNKARGTYHLQVVHTLSEDGTIRLLFDRAQERHRCVPLVPALAQLLLDYKKHLMAIYTLNEEDLALCPIILENPSCLKKSITKIKPCSLKAASAKIRAYFNSADLPTNEVLLPNADHNVETDLNDYQGNIAYTNLKYHLRHTCKFTEGELCYFLGLRAPDTFSRHYCAYDHPVLQYRMACKLNRWFAALSALEQRHPPVCEERIIQGTQTLVIPHGDYGLIRADISIFPQLPDASHAVLLDLSNNHGIDGTIVSFEIDKENFNGKL